MFASHALPGVQAGPDYDEGSEEGLMVVLQIETKGGLEDVEKIAQVAGVDVLFIGALQ
jgi:4-hydroxy-2-oxoheptanedioate aldolase